MYAGTYYHKVEEKGRIAVPVKFRDQLGKNPMVTRGLDGCLFLYSQETWNTFISSLEGSTIAKKVHRDFTRLMTHEASELEIDAQGRILVPEGLRNKAKLTKTVVFAGSLDHVELWNSDAYASYSDSLEKNAELIAEQYGTDLPGKQGVYA